MAAVLFGTAAVGSVSTSEAGCYSNGCYSGYGNYGYNNYGYNYYPQTFIRFVAVEDPAYDTQLVGDYVRAKQRMASTGQLATELGGLKDEIARFRMLLASAGIAVPPNPNAPLPQPTAPAEGPAYPYPGQRGPGGDAVPSPNTPAPGGSAGPWQPPASATQPPGPWTPPNPSAAAGPAPTAAAGPAPTAAAGPAPTAAPLPLKPAMSAAASPAAAAPADVTQLKQAAWSLLQKRCANCHNSGKLSGGIAFFADDKKTQLQIPVTDWILCDFAVYDNTMPPGADKLSTDEYNLLRGFIQLQKPFIRQVLRNNKQ